MDNFPRQRPTRIKRKKIWEETFVPCLPEDLQDLFEKLIECGYTVQRCGEELALAPQNSELHKALFMASWRENNLSFEFWNALRERYNNWLDPLGIRDGYEVVIERRPNGPFTNDPQFPGETTH